MSFLASKTSTKVVASPDGIPFLYGTGDNTTAPAPILAWGDPRIGPNSQGYSYGAAQDKYGTSVAIGYSRLVVGSPGDDDNGDFSGSVYIHPYVPRTLAYATIKIKPSIYGAQDSFGASVAVGSGKIVVGSPGNSSSQGRVFIFSLDGAELATITEPTRVSSNYFGRSVAVGSGVIVIASVGGVYTYTLAGTLIKRITTMPTMSVAISNGRIVAAGSSGQMCIYDLQGVLIRTITGSSLAPGATGGTQFPRAVAIGNGRIIATGENSWPTGITDHLYIFDMDGNLLHEVVNPYYSEQWGYSRGMIAIGNGRIVVGASNYQTAPGAYPCGIAYVYDLAGNLVSKFKPSGIVDGEEFGTAVAVRDGVILIGAAGAAGASTGSAGVVFPYSTPDIITAHDVDEWGR